MNSIFLIEDFINNGFKEEVIDILYLISILFGIFTIINKNPIVSVLFLIGLFVTISGLLILVGLNFIGLSYILVYVGAVSILFLFILMLINIRISELLSETNNDLPLAVITVILFYSIIRQILPYNLEDQDTIINLSNSLFEVYNTETNNEYKFNEYFNEKIVYASSNT